MKVIPSQMVCAQVSAYIRESTTEPGKSRIIPTFTLRKAFETDTIHFLSGDSKGINFELSDVNRFLNLSIPTMVRAFVRMLELENEDR